MFSHHEKINLFVILPGFLSRYRESGVAQQGKLLVLDQLAWLAQSVEYQSAVQEVQVGAADWTNTQGLKLNEENVTPL